MSHFQCCSPVLRTVCRNVPVNTILALKFSLSSRYEGTSRQNMKRTSVSWVATCSCNWQIGICLKRISVICYFHCRFVMLNWITCLANFLVLRTQFARYTVPLASLTALLLGLFPLQMSPASMNKLRNLIDERNFLHRMC
jgi:hypothetical protein